jgi:proteasome accessory factor C
VPGADPEGALATALDKLRTVLGVGADDGLDVELGAVPAGILETLRRAVDSRRKVHLDYYSFGRDGHSSRVVRPWKVFNSNGQWYLTGWCELAQGERLFRVDRISAADLRPDTFAPPAEAARAPGDVFHPGPEDPRVVLDLDPAAHWIAEQYPHDRVVDLGGGVLRVTLPAGQRAWLERLLLRAGPAVRVVEGDAEIGALAALRLLARYRPAQPVG